MRIALALIFAALLTACGGEDLRMRSCTVEFACDDGSLQVWTYGLCRAEADEGAAFNCSAEIKHMHGQCGMPTSCECIATTDACASRSDAEPLELVEIREAQD